MRAVFVFASPSVPHVPGSQESEAGSRVALTQLNADALSIVVSFLPGKALCEVSCTCKLLHELVEAAEDVWEVRCQLLWANKVTMPKSPLQPWHLAAYPERIALTMSVRELKSILKQRLIRHDDCVEKSELVARLVLTNPREAPACTTMQNKWHAAYAASIKDSKRTLIRKDDIVNGLWTMVMNQSMQSLHPGGQNFHPDFTYTSLMHEHPLDWRFVADNVIQCASYPVLRIKRVPSTWGWTMWNEYVSFLQDGYAVHY